MSPGADIAGDRARGFAALDGAAASAQRDALLHALGDGDWRVRREAALALVRSPDRVGVIERLLDRVLGGDIEARNAALDALRTLRAAAVPQVLARLAAATGPRRRFLVEALLEGATPGCLPLLRALLDDADPNLPPAAIEVVAALRDPSAVPALVEALAHRDRVVRIGALIALQSRPEPAPIEALSACARDPLTVRAALSLLATRPEPEAFEVVLHCIERGDRHALTAAVRACEAAGRTGDPALRARLVGASGRWCPAVLGLAHDRREELVSPAIWMLGHASAPAAADAVLRALGSPHDVVRAASEDALDTLVTHAPLLALSSAAVIGAAAQRAVLRALSSSDAATGDEVLAALVRSVDDPIVGVEALLAFAAHAPPARRGSAWSLLLAATRRWPERQDLGVAAQTLLARSPALPADAAFGLTPAGLAVALAWVRSGGALDPALVDAAFASDDPGSPGLGLRLVEALGDPRWAPACEALLEHPAHRAQAIGALRACGLGPATLTAWLSDPRPGHRLTAALSLAERSLLPAGVAVGLLDDPDPEVALAALHALGRDLPPEWLRRVVRRGDPMLAQEALAVTAAAWGGAAPDLLFEALGHAHASVRSAAVACLDASSPDARARLHLRLAEERDPEVAMRIERLLESASGG